MAISGILNVDKPYGFTSMEVVRRVKRASRQKRVGHAGTLDPIATGVLPICLGQATRMMEYLVDGTKIYRTVVELGVNTDTYDALGKTTSRVESVNLSKDEVTDALMKFKDIDFQVPPMFSALKKEGKRLYDLARAGIEVERKPRNVEVFDISLIDWIVSPVYINHLNEYINFISFIKDDNWVRFEIFLEKAYLKSQSRKTLNDGYVIKI